jgi:hypothetical protein
MKITFEIMAKPEERKRQAAISPFYEGSLLIQGITMIDVEKIKTNALGEISIPEIKYKISAPDASRNIAVKACEH